MQTPALFYRRILFAFATTLIIFIIGGSNAAAQRFQYTYGPPTVPDAGRFGVRQLPNGGYIAVGETFPVNPATGISNAYVVMTNPDGSPAWSAMYDIGGHDSATDVIQDRNGDFIVTGVTGNGNGCAASRDIFILKIDPNGNLLLPAHTYGYADSDEMAWNIIAAEAGPRPGDFVVAGSTTWRSGNGRDGYILRVDSQLDVVFHNRYFGLEDEYFYGVEEAQVDGSGDIVAVGATSTWTSGNYDLWVVRVNGIDGQFYGAPQGAASYGGARSDEGFAVVEIRQNTFQGDFVVTGVSESRLLGTSQEVLMLQFDGNPCNRVIDQFAGDAGNLRDGGIDLKEDAFPLSADGDVIVTGFTNRGDNNLLAENVFLQRFEIGTMNLSGRGMAYGGDGGDWGWSVNNAIMSIPADNINEGYIIAGFTQSPSLIGTDPQQLYLIKTDMFLKSGCNEVAFDFLADVADLSLHCINPQVIDDGNLCERIMEQKYLDRYDSLCYEFLPALRKMENGNEGLSGAGKPVELAFAEGRVAGYPNPVISGARLNLRFDMTTEATAHITVTDVLGRVIAEKDAMVKAGSDLHAIETTGWSAGSYMIRVSIGDRASTMRVVVVER